MGLSLFRDVTSKRIGACYEVDHRQSQLHVDLPSSQINDSVLDAQATVADDHGHGTLHSNRRDGVVSKPAQLKANLVIGKVKMKLLLGEAILRRTHFVHQGA